MMKSRFEGQEGRSRLVHALTMQSIVDGAESLAEQIADEVEIIGYEDGNVIIAEGGADNEIFFILTGRTSIRVKGREVAPRYAKQHVGEMAVVDPTEPRSASVVAIGDVVVAKLSEESFSKIADANPVLWRNIACEMGNRLRQRNRFVVPQNPLPEIFIGSSSESLDVARAIRDELDENTVRKTLWTKGVFWASNFPIDDLCAQVTKADFAILVLGPDDVVVSRDEEFAAPRDNVVFELGLFMGALGRKRSFLISPSDIKVKIPTDLLGLTTLRLDWNSKLGLPAQITSVTNEIHNLILKSGCR